MANYRVQSTSAQDENLLSWMLVKSIPCKNTEGAMLGHRGLSIVPVLPVTIVARQTTSHFKRSDGNAIMLNID